MITIEIDIASEDIKRKVQGYATKSKFLGVHKGSYGSWNITHLISGFAVRTNIPRKKDALKLVDQIMDKLDWSQSAETILKEFYASDRKLFV